MSELAPVSSMPIPVTRGCAGAARIDITPPIGAPLIGFAGRGPATGVLDPLTATVLFLQSGTSEGSAVALVSCDLEGIDDVWVHEVEQQARKAVGIEGLRVIVFATHTHYAPAGPSMDNEGELEHPLSIAYTRLLVYDLVGAVVLACSRARPACVRALTGECHVGVNRREMSPTGEIILGQNPAGPTEPRVVLMVVEGTDGDGIATVVNFACHPVCLGAEYRNISSDFVGPLRSAVERLTGMPMLFLQGAAGDINPKTMGGGERTALDTAMPLAAEVLRLWNKAERMPPRGISIRVRDQTFEYSPLLPETRYEAEAAVRSLAARLSSLEAADNSAPGEMDWTRLRLSRAREALNVVKSGHPGRAVVTHQYVMTVADGLAIATAPCELFTVLGQRIVEGSPFALTVFAGYANGMIGYVPDRRSYEEGGYEITHATLVARGVGEEIVGHSIELLNLLTP